MASKYIFRHAEHRIPFCCGVYESGGFATSYLPEAYLKDNFPFDKPFDSARAAHKHALESILNNLTGYSVQFWFYKNRNYDGTFVDNYIEDDFRQLVKEHPNCIELAKYHNPNSGNIINGFMIMNNLNTEEV